MKTLSVFWFPLLLITIMIRLTYFLGSEWGMDHPFVIAAFIMNGWAISEVGWRMWKFNRPNN